ncbi:MAG: hypothetical protein CFE21_08415 [Bacteroidetes bacterium B1(2017)]|nr:MAG: hypothetical protein CFE21_08415 [Bacteroidetes bacterium B1(2017)]
MEKVFQIHLAGVLFTIEEQAYLQLKSYLDHLHQHFSTNSEVVQDIESRMAELFTQKLGSNRNTLFVADVKEVTSTLGNIDQMDEHGEVHKEKANEKIPFAPPAQRKLRRSPTDQSLGGVCSGIASFFDVDPVLVRVSFVILLVVYGSGVLLYLILWMVIPEAKGEEAEYMRLQRLNKTKRLFRDADNRVVGGVSAGLSNYFDLDRTWIRLIFLASIFLFGTGFWLYVVLWIIIPKAVSASDKLLMRGESVDIRSIEREVMQNQGSNKMNNFAQHGSTVLGKLFKGVLKLFGGLFALLLFTCVIAISIGMVAVFFNLGKTHFLNELIDFTIKDDSIIYSAKIGVMLTLLVPFVGLLLIVVKTLFKVKFINKNWAFTMVGLFMVGIICLAYSGIRFGTSISQNETKTQLEKISIKDTLELEGIEMPFNNLESNDGENEVEMAFEDKGIIMDKDNFSLEIDDVKLKQGKSDSVVLKVVRRAHGKNKENALEQIEMIEYNPIISGNKIIIPAYFNLAKNKQFSWQEVDVTLWVPEGKVIHLDMAVKGILDDNNLDEADGEYYKFVNGTLTCIDCKGDVESEDENYTEDEVGDDNKDLDISIGDKGVKMKINISSDEENSDSDKHTTTRRVIRKDGKEISIEETKKGPVTITKTTEIKKQKE